MSLLNSVLHWSRRHAALARVFFATAFTMPLTASYLAIGTPAESPAYTASFVQDQVLSNEAAAQGGAEPLDYDIPDGHFFRQNSNGDSPITGFSVTGPMYQAFLDLGGIVSLGYPVSREFDAPTKAKMQAFQRGIVQVDIREQERPAVTRVNVLDVLSSMGKDDWLEQEYAIPEPKADKEDSPGDLALLGQDASIARAVLTTRDWRQRFGMPVALKRSGKVITLRLQRAIVRRWLVDSPEASAGSVVATDGVYIAIAAGLIPPEAMVPSVSPKYGWLRIADRHIVNTQGEPVRIAGVNWSGFELRDFAPRGLAVRDYTQIIDELATHGFNTIRLPFSNEMVERDPFPDPLAIAACSACQGKRALEIMDVIIEYAGRSGLRIILDNHFSSASDQTGAVLWYSKEYPEENWIKDWETLARRYADNPAVIGFDLRNEPHGPATWGSGDPATDWRFAAEKAGKAILAINPHLLIIVEGIEHFPKPDGSKDSTWWGGNLLGARDFPVRLPAENLLYSPHEYGPSLYKQRWFNESTSPESLLRVWQHYWAFLNLDLDRPLLIGELGTGNNASDVSDMTPGSQGQWFQAMLGLIRQRDNIYWLYWTINAEDVFALLDDSYATAANPAKLAALAPLMGNALQPLPLLGKAEPAAEAPNIARFEAR